MYEYVPIEPNTFERPPTRAIRGATTASRDGFSVAPLSARSCPDLPLDALAAETAAGALVLASAHYDIRRPDTTPPHRGGHLVLVIGCAGTEVVVHNPSGDRAGNQAFATVSRETFERFYAGRESCWGRVRRKS